MVTHTPHSMTSMPAAPGVSDQTQFVALCGLHLQRLVSVTGGVNAALLVGSGGAAIAASPGAAVRSDLSSLTWGLLTLSDATLSATDLGLCEHLTVESNTGQLIVLPISAEPYRLCLGLLADRTALLGEVLWAARHCAQVLHDTVAITPLPVLEALIGVGKPGG
jgi:uncharacterized protein